MKLPDNSFHYGTLMKHIVVQYSDIRIMLVWLSVKTVPLNPILSVKNSLQQS